MKKNKTLDVERRESPRVKDNIFIRCQLNSGLPCRQAGPTEEFEAISEDISAGGLMFKTERNISKESKVNMEIGQPIDRDKTMIFCIPVLTKVIWVRKIAKDHFEEGENKYSVGVEFLEIQDEDRQRIIQYAEADYQ